MWAPKEMALFSACICRLGKRFDLFTNFVSHKSYLKSTLTSFFSTIHVSTSLYCTAWLAEEEMVENLTAEVIVHFCLMN